MQVENTSFNHSQHCNHWSYSGTVEKLFPSLMHLGYAYSIVRTNSAMTACNNLTHLSYSLRICAPIAIRHFNIRDFDPQILFLLETNIISLNLLLNIPV